MIKEMPTHIREYYKAMREAYTQKKNDAIKEIETLNDDIKKLHSDILDRVNDYEKYNINLSLYPEFINNEYKDGTFLRMCKGAYINRGNDYELTSDLFNLLKLAKKQYRIYELDRYLDLYDRILSVKVNDYTKYVKEYFNIVHKKMIIEGKAYSFGNGIGDIFINRCRNTSNKKKLDYKATKLKKAEIVARGGRLYNKEEAEWCKKNGIEYNAEDGRVYLHDEYYYEVALCYRKFKNYDDYEFTTQDYRSSSVRGKSNEQLIEECNGDLDKICELPVDLKTKLTMCNSVNKMLYTNFIRNESQTPYNNPKTNR